jgi:hypothetical protein
VEKSKSLLADRQGEIPPVVWGYAQAARDLGIAPERIQGLDPIPAPTQNLAGRATGRRLADGLPSANNLRKTEVAWHEYRGLLAWRWDYRR